MSTDNEEIERKFKIDPARFLRWLMSQPKASWSRTDITQHYIAREPEVRVRWANQRYEMAFKYPTSEVTTRKEVEFEVPDAKARELISLALRTLHKERFTVQWDVHTWYVDCVFGQLEDQWVAEIELQRSDEPFERPPWLREEVTGRPEFTSFALATPTK